MTRIVFSIVFALFSFTAIAQAEQSSTFSMIKPRAVKEQHIGAIVDKLEYAGLKVCAIKMTRLTPEQATAFYKEHEGKPFFGALIEKITSGPIVALVLQGDDAVTALRTVIGATNPEKAEPNTIRALFGKSLDENAIHGSDSPESAAREIKFFFTPDQIYQN